MTEAETRVLGDETLHWRKPMPKPKLLFLSHLLPYPPDSGAAIRTYNVLRILSAAFDVTALCFSRAAHTANAGPESERLAMLDSLGQIEAFPIPAESSRPRFAYDHIRSIVSGKPYVHFIYESRAFKKRLHELLGSQRFDLVHVDSLDLARYLSEVGRLPAVCVHHNVESALLRRRAAAEPLLIGTYLRFQAALLERYERHWCPRLDLNVAVSEDDRLGLEGLAPKARFEVFPNGVDLEHYRPMPGPEEGLVFVGGTRWFPNKDALVYLVESVLPRLRERGLTPPVRWVGRSSASEQERFSAVPGLTLTGYIDDERPWVQRAACFVVPLRVGGGTRLKILNAWAMGKAVVSTSVGCEGLAAVNGENILVADSADEFANAVARVLTEPELRSRLATRGRATAEQVYGWPTIGGHMVDAYLQLLGISAKDQLARGPVPVPPGAGDHANSSRMRTSNPDDPDREVQ